MSQSELAYNLKEMIFKARKDLLINKNSFNAINMLLEMSGEVTGDELYRNTLALAYLENKDYSMAAEVYYKANALYQVGFCELLLGNINKARLLWNEVPDSEASNWGICLLGLIQAKTNHLPSFIQIRNHLECDLGYFLQAERLEYVENIVKCAEALASVNLETYKFIGKALLYNGFENLSVNYLLKSQKLVPQDAEIYYQLSRYSYKIGAIEDTECLLNQCLELNKCYTPAKDMLKKISIS